MKMQRQREWALAAALFAIAAYSPAGADQSPSNGGASGTPVHGALDRDVIRRVIRGHLGEVKTCYERMLVTQPDLEEPARREVHR
jgi:hypothetical protein